MPKFHIFLRVFPAKAPWRWNVLGAERPFLTSHRLKKYKNLHPRSFLWCYLFSKCNIYFFILVFSDPTSLLFSVFLFLCSTFPVFYFLPFSSVCLSLHILYFLFLSFLSVFYFLALPSIFLL